MLTGVTAGIRPSGGIDPQTAHRPCAAPPGFRRYRDGRRRYAAGSAVPSGRRAALMVAVCAGLSALALLVRCSTPDQMLLVARTSQPRAVAAGSPSATAGVAAAYTAYFPALLAAEPQPQARAVAMLAPYAAPPYLGNVLTQIAAYRADDEVSWGYLVPHITSVQISGDQAIVRDCQDASNAWLVSSVTGQVIPGTTGYARTYLIAGLARGNDGRWRLTFLGHLTDPCEPVPSPS